MKPSLHKLQCVGHVSRRASHWNSHDAKIESWCDDQALKDRIQLLENMLSRGWFRSIDLWDMGPARFRCATLLCFTWLANSAFSLYCIGCPQGKFSLMYRLHSQAKLKRRPTVRSYTEVTFWTGLWNLQKTNVWQDVLQTHHRGSGGIWTHASRETGALIQRLRPLGHTTCKCAFSPIVWTQCSPLCRNYNV